MTKHLLFLATLAAIVTLHGLLAGRPATATRPQVQHTALGSDPPRLFIGDGRNGEVRVFQLRPYPIAIGKLMTPERNAVLDIQLDTERGRVWVLGPRAAYAYDVNSLRPLRRVAAPPGVTLNALALEADGALSLRTQLGAIWHVAAATGALEPAAGSPGESSPASSWSDGG